MKENKNIDWLKILKNVKDVEDTKQNFINRIFLEGSRKLILFVLEFIYENKNKNFKWKELESLPTFELPLNSNLKQKDIVDIIKKLNKLDQIILYYYLIIMAEV